MSDERVTVTREFVLEGRSGGDAACPICRGLTKATAIASPPRAGESNAAHIGAIMNHEIISSSPNEREIELEAQGYVEWMYEQETQRRLRALVGRDCPALPLHSRKDSST